MPSEPRFIVQHTPDIRQWRVIDIFADPTLSRGFWTVATFHDDYLTSERDARAYCQQLNVEYEEGDPDAI